MTHPLTPDEWKSRLRAGSLPEQTAEQLAEFIEALETRIHWLQLAVAERDRWITDHADTRRRICTSDLIRLADEHFDPTQYMSIGWSALAAAINHEILHGRSSYAPRNTDHRPD